jgi:hypothetical protein
MPGTAAQHRRSTYGEPSVQRLRVRVPRRSRVLVLAATLTGLISAAATACSDSRSPDDGSPTRSPATTVTPTPGLSPTAAMDSASVDAAYRAFWPVLTSFHRQPESQWRTVFGRVAVDPQLSFAIAVTRQQERNGITVYGVAHPRSPKVTVGSPGRATIRDCADFSRTGQANASTKRPRTVGVARTPLSVTLIKSRDGRWRVSQVTFLSGNC